MAGLQQYTKGAHSSWEVEHWGICLNKCWIEKYSDIVQWHIFPRKQDEQCILSQYQSGWKQVVTISHTCITGCRQVKAIHGFLGLYVLVMNESNSEVANNSEKSREWIYKG